MKKSNFVTLVMSTVGGILLAIGMCMTMVWGMMINGILVGIVGIVILLALIPICNGIK